MAIPDGILSAVRNYLDILWEDEAGDIKITGIIARGIAYLDRTAGAPLNYEEEGQARALLLDYVRYVRSNAFDEFQKNYQSELLSLQMQTEVPNDTESAENASL